VGVMRGFNRVNYGRFGDPYRHSCTLRC